MCSPIPDVFSCHITPQFCSDPSKKMIIAPEHFFLAPPVYENINPYGLTGTIIAFSRLVYSCSAMTQLCFSPLAVVHCSTCGIDPMANSFAVANLGGNLFLHHLWLHTTETTGNVEYPFQFFLERGESNNSFKIPSLIMY
jgi:hypothetical protein